MRNGVTPEGLAWLRERSRPQNWIDIAPDEQLHEGIGDFLPLAQVFQMWFGPEVRRRLDGGMIGKDWTLYAAQSFQPRGGRAEIRLNDEITGVTDFRPNRPMAKGEQIKLSDIAEVVYYDLLEEDLDAKHFTIWWSAPGWKIFFDARPGRTQASARLERALEFAQTADWTRSKGFTAATIDALHSAYELTAKAYLILHHREADRWKSHGKVHSELNKMSKMGNVEAAFVTIFNRLSNVRSTAKYAPTDAIYMPEPDDIEIVKTIASRLLQSAMQRPAPS